MNIKERNAALVEAVELTEDELREAILEGKRKKYFKEKHADYWTGFEGNVKVIPEKDKYFK